MIKMPLEQLLEKLKEKSGLSDDELNVKLQQKMDQLSGLISKEGAAHIVANELGVALFEQTSGHVKIKDLLEGMRDVIIIGKPTRVFEIKHFTTRDGREGQIGSFVLGDDTGTIRVAAWNEKAKVVQELSEKETVVRITGGFLKSNQGRVELHVNDRARIELDPSGVSVELGDHQEPGRQFPPAERRQISVLEDGMQNVELLGTVVQVFDPRFYEVCPECGKRARPKDGAFFCEVHNEVNPSYAFLVSFFIDDGTANVRVTCFRNTALRLCGVEEAKMLECREDPMRFEDIKTDLLGQIVKVVGRVKRNDMFDRLEFTAQLVFPEPDPKDEK